jgi:hypothetical protein
MLLYRIQICLELKSKTLTICILLPGHKHWKNSMADIMRVTVSTILKTTGPTTYRYKINSNAKRYNQQCAAACVHLQRSRVLKVEFNRRFGISVDRSNVDITGPYLKMAQGELN